MYIIQIMAFIFFLPQQANQCLHLFEAVDKNDIVNVEKMVKNGCSVNIRNAKGQTLLMRASSVEIAKLLVGCGAEIDLVMIQEAQLIIVFLRQ